MKRILLIVLMVIFTTSLAMAQQTGDTWTGVVDVCGEDVLTITKADELPDDDGTMALDDLLRQFVTYPDAGEQPLQDGVPGSGAVLYLETPDGIYFRSVGAGDVENCAPIDPSTPFPIGSNTKMFTTNVIYQLQEEGLLSTSDLVSDYLPDEIGLWDGTEAVTIDMLLNHTSGLPDYLNSQDPAAIGVQLADPESPVIQQAFTPEELVQNTVDTAPDLLFEPGAEAQWEYSNTGYIMLGQIIEQVTGQSYVDAVTERIIEPLGMENTIVTNGIVSPDVGMVGQYLIDQNSRTFIREMSDWNTTQAWSAGSIVSTPEDMATFLRAHYSGELFNDPATLEAILTPASPGYVNSTDDFYYMHGGNYLGGFLGHGGQTLGTESDLGYDPENDIVIVTWSNTAYAYTGHGVFHVGSLLGLTRTWGEIATELLSNSIGGDMPQIVILSVNDIVGIEFTSTGMYMTDTQTFLQIPEGGSYNITFMEDGTVSITADCNTVNGTYTAGDDSSINIELGASTMVACPEGSLADDYLAIIDNAVAVQIFSSDTGTTLLLSMEDQTNVGFTAVE